MIDAKVVMRISMLVLAAMLCATNGTANAADDEWEFALSPLFLWGVSLEGESSMNGKGAPLDLEFRDDILENMEGVFTLHFEARKADWSLFAEYLYIDLNPNAQVQAGPLAVSADITFKEDLLELGAGWAFSDNGRTRWELIGGGRYTDQSITVAVDVATPVPPIEASNTFRGGDDWWQAFAGIRVAHVLSDRWTFIGRGDLGYGGSDNSSYNLAFQFDYRFRDWGSAFFGARYLSYDYDSSNYGFDAAKAGPLAGLTVHW
jgi:hypothetical protein